MSFSFSGNSQQYNSDSYLSKPHGMATIILTTGQRNSMIMNTFSLVPRCEFTAAVFVYNKDKNSSTDDGYSTSFYGKYMFYENEAKTGGFSMKGGTGMDPGYLDGEDRIKDAFKTYWINAPTTLSFWKNVVSWDIMPGVSVTKDYGEENKTSWAFTYSTRVAIYPFDQKFSVVTEIYGAEGQIRSVPEIRTGFRWEPNQHVVLALTIDDEIGGTNGAGFEVGVMLFSPQFLCFGKCK